MPKLTIFCHRSRRKKVKIFFEKFRVQITKNESVLPSVSIWLEILQNFEIMKKNPKFFFVDNYELEFLVKNWHNIWGNNSINPKFEVQNNLNRSEVNQRGYLWSNNLWTNKSKETFCKSLELKIQDFPVERMSPL
jgi:hypothetical protein